MVCPAGAESAAVTYTTAAVCVAVYVFALSWSPVSLGGITPSNTAATVGSPVMSKVAWGVVVPIPTWALTDTKGKTKNRLINKKRIIRLRFFMIRVYKFGKKLGVCNIFSNSN